MRKDHNNFLIGTKENWDKETVPGTPLIHPRLTGIRPRCHQGCHQQKDKPKDTTCVESHIVNVGENFREK